MRKLYIPFAISVVLMGLIFWLLSGTPDVSYTDPEAPGPDAEVLDPITPLAAETATTAAGRDTPSPGGAPGTAASPAAPNGALLRGVVTNDLNEPLPGARVFLTVDRQSIFRDRWQRTLAMRERILGRGGDVELTDSAVTETTTNEKGEYAIAIESIPRRSYHVVARHEDFAAMRKAWKWTPRPTEINFRLVFGDSITGTVLDEEGRPVAAAIVEAYSEGGRRRFTRGGAVSDRTETDVNGRFKLNVAAGVYRVRADAQTHEAESQSGVASGTEDVSITLETLGALAGRVVDEGGQPVPGVKVAFMEGDYNRRGGRGALTMRWFGQTEAEAVSDAAGRFQLLNVPYGSYTLVAEKAGFVIEATSGRTSREEVNPPVELKLNRAAVLSGTVTDPEGNPVAGAYVAVGPDRDRRWGRRGRGRREGRGEGRERSRSRTESSSGEESVASEPAPLPPEPLSPFGTVAGAETDRDGRFRFDTLAPGTYALSVESDRFVTFREDELELEDPQNLTISLHSGRTLTGQVISSANGSPVKDATVQIRMGDRDRHQAKTGDDGRFSLAGLTSGQVREVRVQADGFTQGFFDDLIIPDGGDLEHDFRLDPSASIAGVVTNKQGEPIFNARVSLTASLPDWRDAQDGGDGEDGGRRGRRRGFSPSLFRRSLLQTKRATTDGEGRFRLDDVDAGVDYSLRVEHSEHLPDTIEGVRLAPGETIKEVELALSNGARIEVHVRGPEGPVSKARVMILQRPEQNPEEVAGSEDEDGGRRFRGRGRGRFGRFGGTSRRVYTGPDGKAAFSGLTGGTYFVSTTAERLQPGLEEAVAAVDQTAAVVVQLLSENIIAGVVQDSRGNPVPGAAVEAYRYPDSADERYKDLDRLTLRRLRDDSETRTDEGGRFRVGNLGEGMYSVRIRARGYAEQRLENVETNRDINVVLEQYGGLQGWVVAAETGQPVRSFEIRLREAAQAGKGEGEEQATATTNRGRGERGGRRGRGRGGRRNYRDYWRFEDESGRFTMDGIPPGHYSMYVTAEGYTGTEARVTVRDGEVTSGVAVEVEEGLAATGVVVQDGGAEPISGAKVYLLALQSSSEREGRRGERAGAGRRALQRLEDRREARRELRREARRLSSSVSELSRAATIKEAIDMERTARKAGSPLVESDAEGRFRLTDLDPGNYAVIASHANFLPARETLRISSRRVIPELRMRLDPGESLEGKITLAGRSPGAEVSVIVEDPTSGYSKRVHSNADGEYTVTGLYAGEYWLKVAGPLAVESEPARVAIKDGTNRFDYRIGGE